MISVSASSGAVMNVMPSPIASQVRAAACAAGPVINAPLAKSEIEFIPVCACQWPFVVNDALQAIEVGEPAAARAVRGHPSPFFRLSKK